MESDLTLAKLFPVGTEKPTEFDMQHLAFIGISPQQLIYDDEKKQWFLKLSDEGAFTIKRDKLDNVKPCYTLIYNRSGMLFNHHNIADTYYHGDIFKFEVNHAGIAEALNDVSNLSSVPISLEEGKVRGSVEACIEGIKNNRYKEFFYDYPVNEYLIDDDLCRIIKLDNRYDHNKNQRLVQALKQNNSLEKILLRGISISKIDLLALIKAVKLIENFKELDLVNSHIEITAVDILDIVKAGYGIPICFQGARTNDTNYPFMKDLLTHADQLIKASKEQIFSADELSFKSLREEKLFFKAAKEGKLAVLKELLAINPTLLNQTKDGKTPLYLAADGRHFKIAKYLIRKGADITPLANIDRFNYYIPKKILDWAMNKGFDNVVQKFLKLGIGPDSNSIDFVKLNKKSNAMLSLYDYANEKQKQLESNENESVSKKTKPLLNKFGNFFNFYSTDQKLQVAHKLMDYASGKSRSLTKDDESIINHSKRLRSAYRNCS